MEMATQTEKPIKRTFTAVELATLSTARGVLETAGILADRENERIKNRIMRLYVASRLDPATETR